MATFSLDDVRATCKSRDAWWTVYLVDPLACRLSKVVANRTSITPNKLTTLSLAVGMGSALCFATGAWWWMAVGAVLFYLSFAVDCMDGKIARLKDNGTPFGLWLDYVGDRVRVLACASGLAYGQYMDTGQVSYVVFGAGVVILDLFRYINGPQIARVRNAMKAQLAEVKGDAEFIEDRLREAPDTPVGEVSGEHIVDIHQGFRSRFPFYDRVRLALQRHRVRPHLFSGIEFHAAVFFVAPLLGPAALLPVGIASGGLLLMFELILIYKLWLATREFRREMAKLTQQPSTAVT